MGLCTVERFPMDIATQAAHGLPFGVDMSRMNARLLVTETYNLLRVRVY